MWIAYLVVAAALLIVLWFWDDVADMLADADEDDIVEG
jgi:hypothetical protein